MPTELVYCGFVIAANRPMGESVCGPAKHCLVFSNIQRSQSQLSPKQPHLFRATSGLSHSVGCRMSGPKRPHLVCCQGLIPPAMGAELGFGESFEGKLHFLGVAR